MVSRNLTDELALLDPEMAAMLEVRRRIAEDPTRRSVGGQVLNPGAVLQGIQDYTGTKSNIGTGLNTAEFLNMFGIPRVDISNTAAEQARRQRELQSHLDRIASGAITQRNVPRDQMTYQDEYDAARQDAAKAPPALQVGVTKDVARINEALAIIGKAPVATLDEFLDLVRADDPSVAGTSGDLRAIYDYLYPRDTWGIFGEPQLIDYDLPPTAGDQPPADGFGIGSLLSGLSDFLGNFGPYTQPTDGLPTDEQPPSSMSPDSPVPNPGEWYKTHPNKKEGDTFLGTDGIRYQIEANGNAIAIDRSPAQQGGQTQQDLLFQLGMIDKPIQPRTAEQFRLTVAGMIDDIDPMTGLPKLPDMTGLRFDDPAWAFADQVEDVRGLYQAIVEGRQKGVSNRAQELNMINQTIAAAQNQRELELDELQAERSYEIARSELFLRATEAMESGRQFDQKYLLDFQRAENDLARINRELDLQEREVDLQGRALDIREGESGLEAQLRREQMGLERYQTDIANPFNVAALNILNASPESRALTNAQTSGVTQQDLDAALQRAQHHAGRSGIGVGDPQIQQMARQLIPQMTTPNAKAAMQAIAQGVSNITQVSQQQMGTQAPMMAPQLPMPSQPATGASVQQREFQPVGTPYTMPDAPAMQSAYNYGQGMIPQPLTDIGFSVPQGAAYGQAADLKSFFPQGLPTTAAISQLPSLSKGLLGATAEATGTAAEDLVTQARAITPSVVSQPASTRVTLDRLLGRNKQRGSLGGGLHQ